MRGSSKKMEALVLIAPNNFEIQQVPVPVPGDDEVLCKVDTTFICGYISE